MLHSLDPVVSSAKNLYKAYHRYNLEKPIEKWAKRSLVAIRDIKIGEKLSEKNIWSKRPGTGIPSRFFFKIVGRVAKRNIKYNTIIKKEHFN